MARHLKIFLLVAAFAALGVFGVGTASATILCTDAGCGTVYKAGTAIELTLGSGTSARLTSGGSTIATCTGSMAKGTTSSESGTPLTGTISSLTWSGCSQTTHTVTNGSLSIEWISETLNGTVVGSGTQVTVQIFGVSCTYGTGEGTHLGTLTGGEAPLLKIATTVTKTAGGFLCPGTAGWDAEYVATEPHAVFVDPPRLLNLCVGANPANAAFGGQKVGSTTKIEVTFKNECKENIKFAAKPTSLGDSAQLHIWPGSDKCSGVELAAAATCTVEFVFEPTEKRGFGARWDFQTVMGMGGGISYSLSGTGT
jgi:hypothetical protein